MSIIGMDPNRLLSADRLIELNNTQQMPNLIQEIKKFSANPELLVKRLTDPQESRTARPLLEGITLRGPSKDIIFYYYRCIRASS